MIAIMDGHITFLDDDYSGERDISRGVRIDEKTHMELVHAINIEHKDVSVVDGKIVIADRVLTDDQMARKARRERDKLLGPILAILDRHEKQARYGLPTTLTEAQAVEVAVYAQALRDVPGQDGFPRSVEWPVMPDVLEA